MGFLPCHMKRFQQHDVPRRRQCEARRPLPRVQQEGLAIRIVVELKHRALLLPRFISAHDAHMADACIV